MPLGLSIYFSKVGQNIYVDMGILKLHEAYTRMGIVVHVFGCQAKVTVFCVAKAFLSVLQSINPRTTATNDQHIQNLT